MGGCGWDAQNILIMSAQRFVRMWQLVLYYYNAVINLVLDP